MTPAPHELRQAALAVSVLHDVDLRLVEQGLVLDGVPPVPVSWQQCRDALSGHDPASVEGHTRLATDLRARRQVADLGEQERAQRLRAVGLPVGHVLHPGPGWVRDRVLGGVLELGLGAVGLDPVHPDEVTVLPPGSVDAPDAAWATCRRALERLGALAAERLARDSHGVLRPYGDADVVTLLGSASLRAALAAGAGGMAAVVVPMRRRGWTRLLLVDPAFGPAAAQATDPGERAFPRPLLVTRDEVALAPDGGRPHRIVLDGPAAADPVLPDVLYR